MLRYGVAAALLVVGAFFALYGLFALTYGGDGGPTYVKIAGRRMDAHLAGGISLAIAAVLIGTVFVARQLSRRSIG